MSPKRLRPMQASSAEMTICERGYRYVGADIRFEFQHGGLVMQQFLDAKWSYVTRGVVDRGAAGLGSLDREPRLGDLVAARVLDVQAHDHLENTNGRQVRLYSGDVVVGAFGNRYATDYYEGYLPTGSVAHLLTAGGVVGRVASAHARRGEPTVLEVLGLLADRSGRPLSLDGCAMAAPVSARAELGTFVVVGSSMGAGKTTTAAALVQGWSRAGLRVGAGKVTGSGSGKDRWMYQDAGAAEIVDFLDFGMASTFGYPPQRLRATMVGIRDALVGRGASVVVLEIADGLLQQETRGLAAGLAGFADGVVLAVADALSAVAGVRIMADLGAPVRAVSGLLTASPLASREAAAATGLPVLSPEELIAGGALELLSGAAVPA
ncbi:DUF1611 domain-containing protein [Pseudonocardia sp.]|uniref:DUF1611 domain-containing protein n=1 Tax=Pseudonocardia sp. TaxID=60912 RepID=UPI002622978E|nr:DUF1611 domain-containing protein [Pseudonocardia sp.]